MDETVRNLFHELLPLHPAERERILAKRKIEPRIRREVESLLKFDAPDSSEFTACLAEAAAEVLRTEAADRCGSYRLLRLLGSGGMGDVYLAEREGEIEQTVAVKLLTAVRRPGWGERFLRERQLLASLNHASIVHVIDAGHTADGRPFLVMEYVAGDPIDVYSARIPIRQRLALFLRVCEGVSHAHRHLIIHRDLKPSNILVDESGQPKLLDFGIAKLLDQTSDATQTCERLLTPSYASPEQLKGELQTTATDIYSLGAVLCKLLMGQSPRELGGAAPRASRLHPEAPPDLDFVLQKALRSEPEERYASVDAFAADIQAVLASRPVAARAGDAWYRTRKFLRRYSVPLAAVTLVIASLSAGLFVANRERIKAERRFAQLEQLSSRVFDLDRSIRNLPGSMPARQRLVAVSLAYLEGLAADARGDLDVSREIAEGYWRVADIQGVPTEFNLGEPAAAEANLKKAGALLNQVLAVRPADRSALYEAAGVEQDRMILAQEANRNSDAQTHGRKAIRNLEAFMRQGHATDAERSQAAAVYGNVALADINMHLYADAEPLARHAVEIARTLHSPDVRLAEGLSLLANALRWQGKLDAALERIRQAEQTAKSIRYTNGTERLFRLYGILAREGMILGEDGSVNLNRPAEAIAALQQAFQIAEQAARRDRNDAVSRSREATAGEQLANILRHSNPQKALAIYNVCLQRLGEVRPSLVVRRSRARLLAQSSYALRNLHKTAAAKRRIDDASAILKSTKDYPSARIQFDSVAYVVLTAKADQEAATGRRQDAIRIYETVLRKTTAQDAFGDLRNAPKLSRIYESLGLLYRATNDKAKAQEMSASRVALWQKWDRKLPNNLFIRSELIAAVR